MKSSEKALEFFIKGYNCSQSVFAAFSDKTGIDEATALKVSLGLGGGVGRMREVCGAVSGAAMVIGCIYGGEDSADKKTAYEKTREFAEKFRESSGSIVCRELIGLKVKMETVAVPDERNAEYYAKRPCARLVVQAAQILENMLEKVDKQH